MLKLTDDIKKAESVLNVTSPAFGDRGEIPVKFTKDGLNVSPPLRIKRVPHGTACLAIIMDEMEAAENRRIHWLVWNIPLTHHINEHHIRDVQGMNDFGGISYAGPGAPKGLHHYHISVYALDQPLELAPGANYQELKQAMEGHVLGTGTLTGYYKSKLQ
ncbi:phospholipid-binding protein, PBP family [Chitinophaga rupis]|uniref:Phospholipid-binding protein, PBP family n=1 Tax=Chitinophaga rupis TaxID=573321 RepID=A0A1H7PVP6_9BACT|nr:YbhB/YbcL family Raf kinase inhibitor-like protein [Chitinophaga rupis]SEL39147.1 phospholipid-binding protein, PBP family [Chitinophaga rupis]